MTDAADTPPTWVDLAAQLRNVAMLFGGPARMRDRGLVERAEWRRIRGWLVALETIARALLVLLAAALPEPVERPPGFAKTFGRAKRGETAEDPNESSESERWTGVAFWRPPHDRAGGGPKGTFREPQSHLSTRSLARRFEALIRVSEAPERYARRLARRMRVDSELGGEALSRRGSRTWDACFRDEIDRVQAAAWRVLVQPAFDTG
jgi:hypothetical protein